MCMCVEVFKYFGCVYMCMSRERIDTTIDKALLKKVRKKMIDKEIKNLNEVIEELLRGWLK
jgi:hypothetical protein